MAAVRKKRLVAFIPRLDRHGGQERSTLEVLTRLASREWDVTVVTRSLNDWPDDLPVHKILVPVAWLRIQLLINVAYFLLAPILAWRAKGIRLTIGATIPFADVRVVQFLHTKNNTWLRSRAFPYPRATNTWRKIYQVAYANWEEAMERWCLPRAKLLIAIADGVARDLASVFKDRQPKTVVIRHAPDQIASHPPPAPVEKVAKHVILFVGALERKGITKALDVLGAVQTDNWEFWVVGDGDIATHRTQAINLKIHDRVRFFGAQDAQAYFACADLFLFPSQYEPFGLVVSEAASHRVLPLASTECGAMELWPDRPQWLQLSATSPTTEWAKAVDRLLSNESERRSVTASAAQSFGSWDWEQCALHYGEALANLDKASE